MEEREGDLRVPLISSLFCLCVLTGGVLLVLYLFVPDHSQPWFPAAGLILIGSPYIFWLLTYFYTGMKRCCFGDSSVDNRQISRRTSRDATMANPGVARTDSKANAATSNNNNINNGKQESGHIQQDGGDASSINSAKEIEMPLALSVASS
ncbi:uncharacterized protein [Nicotiana tomentosiformis]|uniref:uncharacterized protein n=1 Tax=Nicotiana tomentosiformis TaxID=4098 RepID=UPI00051B5E9B|nr:uncharacterized protein LOC104100643 [Nicotiana tomentosiformis]